MAPLHGKIRWSCVVQRTASPTCRRCPSASHRSQRRIVPSIGLGENWYFEMHVALHPQDDVFNYHSIKKYHYKSRKHPMERSAEFHGPKLWHGQIVDLAGRENEQTSECKDERFRELRRCGRYGTCWVSNPRLKGATPGHNIGGIGYLGASR